MYQTIFDIWLLQENLSIKHFISHILVIVYEPIYAGNICIYVKENTGDRWQFWIECLGKQNKGKSLETHTFSILSFFFPDLENTNSILSHTAKTPCPCPKSYRKLKPWNSKPIPTLRNLTEGWSADLHTPSTNTTTKPTALSRLVSQEQVWLIDGATGGTAAGRHAAPFVARPG